MINISSDSQAKRLSFTIRSACVWHLDCAYKHTGQLVCNQRHIKLTAWGKVPPWHATRRRTGDRVPKVTSTDIYRKTGSLRVTTTHHSLPSLRFPFLSLFFSRINASARRCYLSRSWCANTPAHERQSNRRFMRKR